MFFTKLKIAPAPFGRLDPSVQPPPHVTGLYTVDALIAGQWNTFGNALGHLILPAITLGLPLTAYLSRIVRRSMADVSRQDYIRTARAKGAGENRVLFRHALPNAMLPVITLSALAFGDLLAGAVLVEAVFSWPGSEAGSRSRSCLRITPRCRRRSFSPRWCTRCSTSPPTFSTAGSIRVRLAR